PTPCKGKSKSQPFAHTFALTGRREWEHGTQGVALGSELVGLSARAGPQTRLFPHNLHQLNVCLIVSEVPIPKKSSGKKILTLLKVCILFSIF
ncbi:MAG: hypothetical protein UDM12_04215, partial [Prevotellamassilia sp.]|nr:hypothetical protein [Prevotellamassilia sp.]